MANIRNVILQKRVEGVLNDLMVRTNAENVILANGTTLAQHLAALLTQADITKYVDERIDYILDVNPGILTTIQNLHDWLEKHEDEFTAIMTELGSKASQADLTALQATVSGLQTALTALTGRVQTLETNFTNINNRLSDVENELDAIGDTAVLAGLSRIVVGAAAPADLRTQDLFIQILN